MWNPKIIGLNFNNITHCKSITESNIQNSIILLKNKRF